MKEKGQNAMIYCMLSQVFFFFFLRDLNIYLCIHTHKDICAPPPMVSIYLSWTTLSSSCTAFSLLPHFIID